MKKIIVGLLIITLIMSTFVGCGKKEDIKETAENKKEIANNSEIKTEPQQEKQKNPFFVLVNGTKPGWPQTLEEDIIRQEMQKRTGFEFYIEGYSGDDYKTKLQLLLASGEYPDIWTGTIKDVVQWKEAGVILPLSDLFDEYGKDLKNFMHDKAIDAYTIDDQLWGMSWGYDKSNPISSPISNGMFIRKDWLDNLGLNMPETLDDYYEILKAFTNNDPDGNGKKDTYGLTGQKIGFGHVYNAFGVNKGDWFEREGKLVIGEMTEEFKEAVLTLRKWYEEGLIDPEFPIYTKSQQLDEKLIGGIVGSSFSHIWYTDSIWRLETALRKNNPNGNFVMVPALEGPYGDRGYACPSYVNTALVISAKCEQPELAIQFLNSLAQDENYLVPHWGIEGEHWKWTDDTKSDVEFIDDWNVASKKFAIGIGNPNRIYRIEDRRHSTQDIKDAINVVSKYLLTNEFEGYVPAMVDYKQLETIVDEAVIKVILGQSPVEELDKMQERWYREGGKVLTEQVNEAWMENR